MTEGQVKSCIIDWHETVTQHEGLVNIEGGVKFLSDAGKAASDELKRYSKDDYYRAKYKVKFDPTMDYNKDFRFVIAKLRAMPAGGVVADFPEELQEFGHASIVKLNNLTKDYGIVDTDCKQPCLWVLQSRVDYYGKPQKPEWTILSPTRYVTGMAKKVGSDEAEKLRRRWFAMEEAKQFEDSGPWRHYCDKTASGLTRAEMLDKLANWRRPGRQPRRGEAAEPVSMALAMTPGTARIEAQRRANRIKEQVADIGREIDQQEASQGAVEGLATEFDPDAVAIVPGSNIGQEPEGSDLF